MVLFELFRGCCKQVVRIFPPDLLERVALVRKRRNEVVSGIEVHELAACRIMCAAYDLYVERLDRLRAAAKALPVLVCNIGTDDIDIGREALDAGGCSLEPGITWHEDAEPITPALADNR